jgi:hypothetical protein
MLAVSYHQRLPDLTVNRRNGSHRLLGQPSTRQQERKPDMKRPPHLDYLITD